MFLLNKVSSFPGQEQTQDPGASSLLVCEGKEGPPRQHPCPGKTHILCVLKLGPWPGAWSCRILHSGEESWPGICLIVACFPAVAVSVAKASVGLRDYPSCLQGRARPFSAHEEGTAQLLAHSTPSWAPCHLENIEGQQVYFRPVGSRSARRRQTCTAIVGTICLHVGCSGLLQGFVTLDSCLSSCVSRTHTSR